MFSVAARMKHSLRQHLVGHSSRMTELADFCDLNPVNCSLNLSVEL